MVFGFSMACLLASLCCHRLGMMFEGDGPDENGGPSSPPGMESMFMDNTEYGGQWEPDPYDDYEDANTGA